MPCRYSVHARCSATVSVYLQVVSFFWNTDYDGLRGFESMQGLEVFPVTTASIPALGTAQPLTQWVPGSLSQGVKRLGREADHSPPSSAVVKNAWSCTSAPEFAFMAWYSKHRGSFTYLFFNFYSAGYVFLFSNVDMLKCVLLPYCTVCSVFNYASFIYDLTLPYLSVCILNACPSSGVIVALSRTGHDVQWFTR
jgi:hypothetical protein